MPVRRSPEPPPAVSVDPGLVLCALLQTLHAPVAAGEPDPAGLDAALACLLGCDGGRDRPARWGGPH